MNFRFKKNTFTHIAKGPDQKLISKKPRDFGWVPGETEMIVQIIFNGQTKKLKFLAFILEMVLNPKTIGLKKLTKLKIF